MEQFSETILLSRAEISFEPHPDVAEAVVESVKVVRYQQNPTPNWGPQAKAVRGRQQGRKRKERDADHDEVNTLELGEEEEREDDGQGAAVPALWACLKKRPMAHFFFTFSLSIGWPFKVGSFLTDRKRKKRTGHNGIDLQAGQERRVYSINVKVRGEWEMSAENKNRKATAFLKRKEIFEESMERFLLVLVLKSLRVTVTPMTTVGASTATTLGEGRFKQARDDVNSATPGNGIGCDDGRGLFSGRFDPQGTPKWAEAGRARVVLVHIEAERVVLFVSEKGRDAIMGHVGVALVVTGGRETAMVWAVMRGSIRTKGNTARRWWRMSSFGPMRNVMTQISL
jgi:hypothetical protein